MKRINLGIAIVLATVLTGCGSQQGAYLGHWIVNGRWADIVSIELSPSNQITYEENCHFFDSMHLPGSGGPCTNKKTTKKYWVDGKVLHIIDLKDSECSYIPTVVDGTTLSLENVPGSYCDTTTFRRDTKQTT